MTSALVIGGSGPSGPHLIQGLLDRGHEVIMFHTGRHHSDAVPDVEHIHASPYTEEGIASGLAGREFDVVVATYGRVRLLARALAGRAGQFISVSGTPVYKGFVTPSSLHPHGLPVGLDESQELVPPEGIGGESYDSSAVRRTEDVVLGLGSEGAFAATVLRYPSIYGPRNPHAWEWSAVRRVLDGRSVMVIPDGGLSIHSRLSGRNAAQSLLVAVDHPDEAAGYAFNCADEDQFSLRQWIEMTMELAGRDLDLVSVPGDIPSPGWALSVFHYTSSPHVVVDTTAVKGRLGYRDAKPAREGLAETVEWLVAHAGEAASWSILDPFDYEAEDEFLSKWHTSTDALRDDTRWKSLTMPLPQTARGTSTPDL